MTPTNKTLLPVCVWAFLQLILLCCGASGFALWAHHPLPHESLALQEMLCGQLIFSAMLFSIVMPTRWALAINLCLMLPFDQLAGVLSNSPQNTIFECWACVGLWMTGLGLLGRILKADSSQMWVAPLATLFTLGGSVLDYLRWEEDSAKPAIGFLANICRFVNHQSGALVWAQASIPVLFLMILAISKLVSNPASTLLHHRLKFKT